MTDVLRGPAGGPLAGFLRPKIRNHRAPIATLGVFVVMMVVFFVANPSVFTDWRIYNAVLTTLPVALFLVVPLVFVVTVGEIDLSFPAVMGFSGWIFGLAVQAEIDPFLALALAALTGMAIGCAIGAIVVYCGLSSLVATLGLSYLIRGVILIGTDGRSIALTGLRDSTAYELLAGTIFGFPAQMIWGALFVIAAMVLYNWHRFGARVHAVGDNPDSAAQMGIDTRRTRVFTFVFVGLGAALAGVFSAMINFTWWPSSGEAYLLPALAAVFVGGTPTWGGIGTVLGAALGAGIVSFIEVGIVSAGLDGFYVQFFYGLIIILALIGHRWNQVRYR